MSASFAVMPAEPLLRAAAGDADLAACWPLMHLLRPHLASCDEFVERIARQRGDGYCLLVAWLGEDAAALAGWRVQENLVHGRHLYVDDLVTRPESRGQRLAARLLQALAEQGRVLGCGKLVLDTGVANTGAQRFYAREGMANTALKFTLELARAD